VTDCPSTLPDGTQCPQVADNHAYTYADMDDCTSFYECWNGCVSHQKCQRNYLYDPTTTWCDSPDRVDCGTRPCTDPSHGCPVPPSSTVAPTGSTTTNSGSDTTTNQGGSTTDCGHILDCSNMTSGWYGDDFNCRKYWHCADGVGQHFTCREGLLYDVGNIMCNYPQYVQCGDRPICDDCDHDCNPQSTEKPREHCQHQCTADGFFEEGVCQPTFCQCVGGIDYLLHCPDNLVFNPGAGTCDFTFNVPGC